MKRIIYLLLLMCVCSLQAQNRRPIDPEHPAWLMHVDVWNTADPQKIIDLIPEDIKPYVVLNLSLSCSYDTERGVYRRPQNGVATLHSWATVCQNNGMWFTTQVASGGHTHIPDNEEEFQNALDTHEEFFKLYKNFLGWNYAEQFWGFDEEGDKSSSKAVDRIKLFAKLVPMHHKYGGFLTISFCGNVWSHPVNPMGMMKRNADFLNACRSYPEAMLFLYKYTTTASWFNNESVTIGPFISGLCKNYGVRYDNCGWNGAIEELCKGDGKEHTYPGAVGIAPVLEQMTQNGACVWDGPELIWTEDFKEVARTTTSDGYQRRNWTTYANFDNIWVDMFRKVIDGSIHIASREEVIARTKIVMKNDVSASDDASGLKINAYAAPIDLYHGLYLQDDPFNARTSYEGGIGTINGYGNNNRLYFKKTGRYQAIPLVIDLYDDLAKSIPTVVKRSDYNAKRVWGSRSEKVAAFDKAYPEVSTGDLFVARHRNQLTCYYPYSYLNSKTTASADIPLQYNSCERMGMTLGKFSTALVKEYEDRICFYFNNFRSDTTSVTDDVVTIVGAKARPAVTCIRRADAVGSYTDSWDAATGTYSLTLSHNGPFDVTVSCMGEKDESELLTGGFDVLPLGEIPVQPSEYAGKLTIEAEDMDFRNISQLVTFPYSSHPDVRGHVGNGFMIMGTNTAGSLRHVSNLKVAGKYEVTVRYASSVAGTMQVRANGGIPVGLEVEQTEVNEWKTASVTVSLDEGANSLQINNTGGVDVWIDQFSLELVAEAVDGVEDEVVADIIYAPWYMKVDGEYRLVDNPTANGCSLKLNETTAAYYGRYWNGEDLNNYADLSGYDYMRVYQESSDNVPRAFFINAAATGHQNVVGFEWNAEGKYYELKLSKVMDTVGNCRLTTLRPTGQGICTDLRLVREAAMKTTLSGIGALRDMITGKRPAVGAADVNKDGKVSIADLPALIEKAK